ncbi:hypothetical protein DPMN_100387 [Dreissena polymorpha]|uniref:Uncharacterized protein n=1 Tax=Dreissena polymorpha TaxID=45954 RepID=A0A9D4LI52_DREPO|nr:hypothetical protein DPMN_100387 [Dreissena polymorpha]
MLMVTGADGHMGLLMGGYANGHRGQGGLVRFTDVEITDDDGHSQRANPNVNADGHRVLLMLRLMEVKADGHRGLLMADGRRGLLMVTGACQGGLVSELMLMVTGACEID